MLNKILFIIKKIVFSALFIYTYDSIIVFSEHRVPINFINISIISIFGVIGMFYLILFSFF